MTKIEKEDDQTGIGGSPGKSVVLTGDSPFLFPFDPWPIQLAFMNSLYEGLSLGKVMIMESPTGTGKSLSLLCGSLKWLHDFHRQLEVEEYAKCVPNEPGISNSGTDEPSWVLEHERKEALRELEYTAERKRKRAQRLEELRQAEKENGWRRTVKRPKNHHCNDEGEEEPQEFLVDEYESDPEASGTRGDLADNPTDSDDHQDERDEMKIIYCSRTHSQISQFIKEMKKTAYQTVKSVSLGSRQTMCINDSVKQLKSVSRMNDKCLDLIKGTSKQGGSCCPYLSKDQQKRALFTDHLHAVIRDIEEIVETGKRQDTCPYFGSRYAVRTSQVVTLPYSMLLQKTARESVGITVKGNIVIIDEAHNLIDAITSVHSVSLDSRQLNRSEAQLQSYLQKYKSRLKGKNLAYIRQLLLLIKALQRALRPLMSEERAQSYIRRTNDFVHDLDIDHINLFKIEKYLVNSRLAQKLQGFAEKTEDPKVAADSEDTDFMPKHVSPLKPVETFLMSLTNPDLEGRIVVNISEADSSASSLKYLLLNPANCFRSIVEDARAVVLAGGTMEPVQDLLDELFPYLPTDRISRFTCGHIIPPTSLLTTIVAKGPSQIDFDFTFEKRNDGKMIDELGGAIANFCNVTPGGVVCFFASYDYLEVVYNRWQMGRILSRISSKKQVFKEPKQSVLVDTTLTAYAQCIRNTSNRQGHTGAILFAVVGGKMSEGINFSDDLGRLVIMVGLPFPNIRSQELKEKLNYVKARASLRGLDGAVANDYYENLCMKAVNQSIGRAIRHRDDYAAIVLLDYRYGQQRIKQKLPGWIRDAGISEPGGFGRAIAEISKFFRGIKSQGASL
ncbi:DNA repair helicase (rad3) [Spizellomyces punctatus DAOM BR117]|uniref:ATP-dependent DNA helicase CHL1 n=1 Tax=Spizellomyces punctatus (strain DAOM BR117) TaxID=645134 RepID=A0A0L0H5F7_SPIPD|nr:DNA repair helicase (rad3) [Spizellomyces punctatus DAOM BR117]KNC95958.1 DNA repair helicase (rad3) [Spizellomyces punctatus DAOM BR117]|eukprot:XP_016603998.1 DNA repair helicase (rad3) [Spizellomyces punctatus DAOM BR117]